MTEALQPKQPAPLAPTDLIEVVAGRPLYPVALAERGIQPFHWKVFVETIWPSAKTTEGIVAALDYCMARKLDPYKRQAHIVPMYNAKLGREVETVWPSVSELRTTAMRTGAYAGRDEAEYGPLTSKEFVENVGTGAQRRTEKFTIEFHEWIRITVYRVVEGLRCAFVGPKVYWLETYARQERGSDLPNAMWRKRLVGQHEKCAEAAALRAAFPEELGGELTAEEMYGQMVDVTPGREQRTVQFPQALAAPAPIALPVPPPTPAPPAAAAPTSEPAAASAPATQAEPPRERQPGENDEPPAVDPGEALIPNEAWSEIRQTWHDRGLISEAQVKRLFAKSRSAGWSSAQIEKELFFGLACKANEIPYGKPYDLIVALFEQYRPQATLA